MRLACCSALAGVMLLLACGNGDPVPVDQEHQSAGEVMFNSQCAMCHGRKGDLGLNGAKDLTKSTLTKDEMTAVVTNGRNGMMAYKAILTASQIREVVDHAFALRKKG